MLADWYFLNCLHFPPRRAATILSIFEIIDARKPNVSLAVTALAELEKAELPVRIYAASKVLRLLSRTSDDADRLRELALDFVVELAHGSEESTASQVESFIRCCINEADVSIILNHAAEIVARLPLTSSTLPSKVPYLDLKEHIAETLLLAGLEALASTETEAKALAATLIEESGILTTFLNTVMEGKAGRLAFLQAFRLQGFGSQNESTMTALIRLRSAFPLIEPDLVDAAARMLCSDLSERPEEVIRLAIFRRFRHALRDSAHSSRQSEREQVLLRLGLNAQAESAFQLLIWQVAICSLMSEQTPDQLAACSSVWWHKLPTKLPRLPIGIDLGYNAKRLLPWIGDLSNLAQLRPQVDPKRNVFSTDSDGEGRLGALTPRTIGQNKEVVSLLLSPWIETRDEKRHDRRESEAANPPKDAEGTESWRQQLCFLRLCMLTFAAVRVFEAISANTPEMHRQNLCRLMAHFEFVFGQGFRAWLTSASEQDLPNPMIPKTLQAATTTLALFVRRQITALVGGFRPGPTPADFASISDAQGGWVDGILVRWVEDVGRLQGVASTFPAWLAEMPRFAIPVATRQKPSILKLAATLLVRQLTDVILPLDPIHKRWQASARYKWQDNGQSLLGNREVLVAPLATWKDWDEYSHLVEKDVNLDPPATLKLTVMVERLLASFDESDEAEAARMHWIDALVPMLAESQEPGVVDRFVELRLIDLVAASSLKGRDEVRIAVVRLLSEQANPTALLRLVNLLTDRPVSDLVALVWPTLRLAVLRGLVARSHLKTGEDISPRDPYQVHLNKYEGRFCEKLAQRFLMSSTPGISTSEAVQLREEFIRLKQESLWSIGRKQLEGIYDSGRNTLVVETGEGVPQLEEWMIQQAVEDPNSGDYSLLFKIGNIPNHKAHPRERLAYFVGGDGDEFGVAVDENGVWEDGIQTFAIQSERPGVPISLSPFGKKASLLSLMAQPGDVAEVEVSRRNDRHGQKEYYIRSHTRGVSIDKIDLDIWDADLSRRFWEPNASNRKVIARHVADGEWKPELGGLADFLCRRDSDGGPPRATLTFIRNKPTDGSTDQWLFAGDPGELYEFSAEDFTHEATESLRHEIAKGNEDSPAGGLLVSVEAVLYNDEVCLSLTNAQWEGAVHPELQCPFDDRNLAWCRCFNTGQPVKVQYDNELRQWFVSTFGKSGFPDRIFAQWQGPQPSYRQGWVHASITEWQQACRPGGYLKVRKLTYELDATDYSKLCANLTGLQDGFLSRLARAWDHELGQDSEIACTTVEGLRVPVPIDSLTLLPVASGTDTATLVERGRKVQFENVSLDSERFVHLAFENTAEPSLSDGRHLGFLVATPIREDSAAICKVLFKSAKEPRAIKVEKYEDIAPLYHGARFHIEIKKGLVRNAAVQNLRIHSVACVWRIETQDAYESEILFVGECFWNNKKMWAAESPNKPGVLLLMPAEGSTPALLAKWNANERTWSGSPLDSPWPAVNSDRTRRFKHLRGERDRFFRVRLGPRIAAWGRALDTKDKTFPGVCGRVPDSQLYKVVKTFIKLDKISPNEAVLCRTFTLDKLSLSKATQKPERIGLEEYLERLAQSAPLQHCVVNPDGKACQLTELHRAGFSEAQSTVSVALNGGTWVTSHAHLYPPHGRGQLGRIDNRWVIDFRGAPVLTIEDLVARLQQIDDKWAIDPQPVVTTSSEQYREKVDFLLNIRISIASLFVVGTIGRSNRDSKSLVWRFEAGYGLVIDIPEARLRSHGSQFDLRYLLFNGDRITSLRFIEVPNVQDGGALLALDIEAVFIEPAPATILYRQAKEFKTVHLLRLDSKKGESPTIRAILGCNERHISRGAEQFIVSRATLDQESLARLRTKGGLTIRANPDELDGGEGKFVYGRMNIDAFEKSQGLDIQFEHINLSNGEEPALQEGELLLLRALFLEEKNNDVVLRLRDIAEDSDNSLQINVPRRRFSCRESLLRRLLADREQFQTEVRDEIFAVRVISLDARGGSGLGSLLRNIPTRRLQALRDHLAFSSEPVFAVVAPIRGPQPTHRGQERCLRLEHRPGIFFTLRASEFCDGRIPTFGEGALVEVKLNEAGKFQLEACGQGERHYLKGGPRLVVAFPKNPLLESNAPDRASDQGPEWWGSKDALFSLGDFPGTMCLAKQISQNGQIGFPEPSTMFAFMGEEHPKIGRVLFDPLRGPNPPVLLPGVGSGSVGAVDLREGADKEPLLLSNSKSRIQLEWRLLTFSDAPISELIRRFRKRAWRYHDDTTAAWQNGLVVPQPTSQHTLETGPLFFEKSSRDLRLRYSGRSLRNWAIPVSDLLDSLGRGSSRFAVAGHSAGDADLGAGLYVEYVPGRVLHLPCALFSWRLGNRRIDLKRLDWRNFIPGDEITICVNEGTALAPDYLDLEEWQRSPRACFGPHRALLPVITFNPLQGCMLLGTDVYHLALPCIRPPNSRSVWLSHENELTAFHQEEGPQRDDCVFVGIDADNQLAIIGAPEYMAKPDRPVRENLDRQWHGLQIEFFLAGPNGAPAEPNWKRIREMIIAVGGAIPTTVEGIDRESKIIFFSLRHQSADVKEGCFTIANVLGYLSPPHDCLTQNDKVILRVGGGLVAQEMDAVISGVPNALRNKVATALAKNRTRIWLEAKAGGGYVASISPEAREEFAIIFVAVIHGEDPSSRDWGIVVRSEFSQRLYWVPSSETAWTEISADDARQHFLTAEVQRPYMARKLSTPTGEIISLIESHKAKQEALSMRVGSEIRVYARSYHTAEATKSGVQSMLAESTTTGLLLRLQCQPRSESPRRDVLAEIVRSKRGTTGAKPWHVVAVPAGERVYRLALPSSLRRFVSRTVEQPSLALAGWLGEASSNPWAQERFATATKEPIERRLIQAAALSRRSHGDAQAMRVAEDAIEHLGMDKEMYVLSALLTLDIVCNQIEYLDQTRGALVKSLLDAIDIVGRRALRSLHVEMLREAIQSRNLSYSTQADALWTRIERALAKTLDAYQMLRLKNLLHFAIITGGESDQLLAASVYLATGSIPPHSMENRFSAEILNHLVSWRRIFSCFGRVSREPFVPSNATRWLNRDLQRVQLQLKNRSLGLELLAPLPVLSLESDLTTHPIKSGRGG